MENNETADIRNLLRTLKILFFALFVSMAIPTGIGIFLFMFQGFEKNELLGETFQFLVPLIAISCILASQIVFRKQIFEIQMEDALQEKLSQFRRAFIMRAALLEAPVFLSVIALFLTGDVINLAVVGVILVIYLLSYPTADKVMESLPLSEEEIRAVRDAVQ